jgi:hypothetical protein
MPHLKSYKTRTIFMGINFIADKDRPTVFDFAHDNGKNITTQPEK